jgi:polyhydroxyalkanoate synthesis regulator phasin
MTDFIKKAFLTGIGLTAATVKALEDETRRLVKKGKLNAGEADKIIGELARSGEKHVKEYRKTLDEAVRKAVGSLGLARRSEVEELKKRLAALEKTRGGRSARK